MFMIKIYYKDSNNKIGIGTKGVNCNKIVGRELKNKNLGEIITIFVEDVVFDHVGISLLIKSKDKVKFSIEEQWFYWIENGNWYNTIVFSHLSGSAF